MRFLRINAEWREILRIFWYLPLPSLLSPEIKRSNSPPLRSLCCGGGGRESKEKYLVEDEVSAVVSGELCDSDEGEV
jgi:hypothetical protein